MGYRKAYKTKKITKERQKQIYLDGILALENDKKYNFNLNGKTTLLTGLQIKRIHGL